MKREHGIMIRQKERVAVGPRHILHLRVGLALILLEGQRQRGEGGLQALAHGGRNSRLGRCS